MKRALALALVCAACTSGGEEPMGPSPLDLAQSCASIAVSQLVRVVDELSAIVSTPGAFSIAFDYDFDGTIDTTIAGTLNNTTATFALSGTLTGSGDLTLNLATATRLSVTGMLTVDDGTCFSEFRPGAIEIDFGTPLTAVIVGLKVYGDTALTVSTPGARLSGDVTIMEDTQQAVVTGTLNGQPVAFPYDIFPSQTKLETLAACMRDQDFFFAEIDFALAQLADIVNNANGDLSSLPSTPGLTTLPTGNPNVLNYRIELEQFGDNLTTGFFAGQLRVSNLNFLRTVLISWIGESETTELGRFTGKSDRFMEFVYDNGVLIEQAGAGSFNAPGCDGGFDILVPIAGQAGTIEYRATAGGDTLVASFPVAFPGPYLRASVNGIPLPPGTVSVFP